MPKGVPQLLRSLPVMRRSAIGHFFRAPRTVPKVSAKVNSVQFPLNFVQPGSGEKQSYQTMIYLRNHTSFHAWPFLSMSSANELKASGVTVISLCISSQPWSGSQGKGFVRELFSREMLPFRKKSSSSGFNLPSASRILMVIWKENRSLWRSNSPGK